jgi:hypothetical protein
LHPVLKTSLYETPLFIALKGTAEIKLFNLFSAHLPLHNLSMHVFPVLLVIITSQGWVDITQTYTSYIYSRPHSNYRNQKNVKELPQRTKVLIKVCDSKQSGRKGEKKSFCNLKN